VQGAASGHPGKRVIVDLGGEVGGGGVSIGEQRAGIAALAVARVTAVAWAVAMRLGSAAGS
jgi:hypothetical protein